MFFQRLKTPGLGHNSYVLACVDWLAVVIYPRRDVDDYLRLARENHLTIAYVLETHRQEDFEFGSRTLAQMTGARIVGGNHTLFGEMDVKLADKQELKVGSTRFIAVEFVDVGWAILVVLLDLDCPRLTHPRCVSARRKRRYL